MFEIVPFEIKHIDSLLKGNDFLHEWMRTGQINAIEGFTGLWNKEVMVCGAVNKLWENRGHVWSIWNQDAKHHFVPVFRGVKKFLMEQPYRRLEIAIPVKLDYAHRRARLLGFKLECSFADQYLPDGEACALYSLLKEV